MSTQVSAALLSSLLLELGRGCQELALDEFRQHVLRAVRRYIQFDVAWWAMVANDGADYRVHSSFQIGLPDQCEELLNLTQKQNVVAVRCRDNLNKAIVFRPEDLYADVSTAVLAQHMGIAQVLAVAVMDEHLQQVTFLSFARRRQNPCFSESDRQLLELLMPHLVVMVDINYSAQISRWRAGEPAYRSGIAVIDTQGAVHMADPAFLRLMRTEFSDWNGPRLPQPLVNACCHEPFSYTGKSLFVHFCFAGRLLLATISQRSALDVLGNRERMIAVSYAKGNSYKQVAREMAISPATVRHYLRLIYDKLEVSDKAALACIVNETTDIAQK